MPGYTRSGEEDPQTTTARSPGRAPCYVEVKNIGTMSPELARRVTAEVSRELAEHLGVPTRRIYVELADAEAHLWGFDGDTFG